MNDLYQLKPSTIMLYGTSWCGDCRRSRRVFSEMKVAYTDIDIDQDEKAAEFVKQVNRGSRAVPTIIFPDGSSLTEPDDATLSAKLAQYQA
jgi:mycoredoxin